MTRNLTVGSPVRLILAFTVPLLIGNVFQQVYTVTDAIVVGRMLGVDALASVGASISLQFLLMGFAIGASTGLAIPVARAFGAGDPAAMRRAVAAGVLISAGIAVLITAIGTLGGRALLELTGTPPELMADSTTFLTVLFGGAAATVAFNFLSAVIRALGDSRTPLLFLGISCLLNAGLVVLFIGGFGMGVEGAAAATVVAQAISVTLCLVLVRRRMPELALQRPDWRIRRGEFGEGARLGLTMGFQMSVIAIGMVVLQFGINSLGAEAVAAFTAAMRVDQVAVAPLASISVAMTTYVAQNFGAGQWWRIRVGVFRMGLLASALAVVLGLVNTVFGTDIVRLFVGTGADRVVAMAHEYLIVNGALYVALALLFVLRNSLQGLGATVVPTIAGFMELLLRAAAGLFLVVPLGFLGVCLAAPLAWVGALVPVAIAWAWARSRLVRTEILAASRCEELAAEVALEP